MEVTERINVLKHEIAILETGYAGIISGQIVDMRDYPDFVSNETTGLIENEHINNYILSLKEEINQITNH
jgi:hypothetical protein